MKVEIIKTDCFIAGSADGITWEINNKSYLPKNRAIYNSETDSLTILNPQFTISANELEQLNEIVSKLTLS